jgi:hypothetical protein
MIGRVVSDLSEGFFSDVDQVLVASGTGPDIDAWFLAIDGFQRDAVHIEELDRVNSFGLIVGESFYRLFCSAGGDSAVGELLVYDTHGVALYRRIDGLADSHGLVWDGASLIVPCPESNEIHWVSPLGERRRTWRASGEGDAWHVNGVHVRDGQLYASAFGRFANADDRAAHHQQATGIVFDVATERDVLNGLFCPHDPRYLDGAWMVCDSKRGRLLSIDEATGERLGVSAQRYAESDDARAFIVVLARSDWRILDRIALPCKELNSLCLIPRALLGSLRRGFRTNAYRLHVQDRHDMFRLIGNVRPGGDATPMNEMPIDDCRIDIHATAPSVVAAGSAFNAELSIENLGASVLFTAPPYPVNIGYSWRDIETGEPVGNLDARRAALPEPIAPHRTTSVLLALRSPEAPGTYALTITLVQEWVRWFDGVDAINAERLTVRVI